MITWINHQINRNSLNPNLIFLHNVLSSHGQKSWTHVFPRRVKQQSPVWRANEMPRGLSDKNTADDSATLSTFTTGQSRWFGYKFLQVMAHVNFSTQRLQHSAQVKTKCWLLRTKDARLAIHRPYNQLNGNIFRKWHDTLFIRLIWGSNIKNKQEVMSAISLSSLLH